MKRFPLVIVAISFVMIGAGCRSLSHSPYNSPSELDRNPVKANELSRHAAACMDRDLAQAEQYLKEALAADLYCGEAHNNLGVCYLKQDKYYEAANEFEWARKLLPGLAEPRTNLALVYERAGKITDALAMYEKALEVAPEHMPTIQAMTKLQITSGRTDDKTAARLQQIALRGENVRWRDWAHLIVAKFAEH